MPFETRSLCDASILVAFGHSLTTIAAQPGDLSVFVFRDVDIIQARDTLASARADIMRSFHKAWRSTRRRMQGIAEGARPGQ